MRYRARALVADVMVGFRDNRTHSKRLATIIATAREKERRKRGGFVRGLLAGWLAGWLAGLAKVSVLECGITISKPDVTFVGQWPRDDPFACNCVSFTTPTARSCCSRFASLLHYVIILQTQLSALEKSDSFMLFFRYIMYYRFSISFSLWFPIEIRYVIAFLLQKFNPGQFNTGRQ